jgi:hypothetical protein
MVDFFDKASITKGGGEMPETIKVNGKMFELTTMN